MKPKIYDFKKRIGKFKDTEFTVSDYFQYYTTGLEDVIDSDMLMITERYNNERSEVLAYVFLGSEHLSDTLLALNNDVYLWDSPYDNNMMETVVDVTYDYIQKIYKTQFMPEEVEKYKEFSRELAETDDNMLRNIIIPKKEYMQRISRYLRDHMRSREVE